MERNPVLQLLINECVSNNENFCKNNLTVGGGNNKQMQFIANNYINMNTPTFLEVLQSDVSKICRQNSNTKFVENAESEVEYTLRLRITPEMLPELMKLPSDLSRISTVYKSGKLKLRKLEYANQMMREEYQLKYVDHGWELMKKYENFNLSWKCAYEIDIDSDFYEFAKRRFPEKKYKICKFLYFKSPVRNSEYRLGWSFLSNEVIIECEDSSLAMIHFLDDIHLMFPTILNERMRNEIRYRLRSSNTEETNPIPIEHKCLGLKYDSCSSTEEDESDDDENTEKSIADVSL